MAELYIGNNKIGSAGEVDTSAFIEATQVTAAALNDLKKITKQQSKDISTLYDNDTSIVSKLSSHSTSIGSLRNEKADASTVYTKIEIDRDNKIVASALASIDTRVTSIESSIGGSQPLYISLEDYESLVDNDTVDEDTLYYIQDLVDTSTLSELVNTSTLSAAINNATSALAPCQFVSLSQYEDLVDNNTVDSDKIYIISDLATQSDFSDFVSYSSLSALVNAVSDIRNSVTTETLILEPNVGLIPELYIRDSNGDLYQINIDVLCQQFGTLIQG